MHPVLDIGVAQVEIALYSGELLLQGALLQAQEGHVEVLAKRGYGDAKVCKKIQKAGIKI